jgi:RNA methyltransferase, TrmH family
VSPLGGAVLGPRHHDVRRLRSLLRDARARASEEVFVLEGPRVIEGALDRGARLQTIYLADGAAPGFRDLLERAKAASVTLVQLRDGVIEKVSTTRTPQPVLAVAPLATRSIEDVAGTGTVMVTVDVSDPGNLGTIIRTAEAAGADGVVATGENSVDVHHPKVVRSTAGAIFGVPVVEQSDPVAALRALGDAGRRRLATRAHDGEPYDRTDLTKPCALVFGNEARGLGADLAPQLDGVVTVPVAGSAESLNVAMAAAVLCFEAARQRRAASVTP